MAAREQVQFLRLLTRFRWHSRRIRSSDACWAGFDSLNWFCENSRVAIAKAKALVWPRPLNFRYCLMSIRKMRKNSWD